MTDLCRVSIEEEAHDRKTSSVDTTIAKTHLYMVDSVADHILSGFHYNIGKVSYNMEDVWALICDQFDPKELSLVYCGKHFSNEFKTKLLWAARKVAIRALDLNYDKYEEIEVLV